MKNLTPYQKFWLPIPILLLIGFLLPKYFYLFAYVDHFSLKPVNIAIGISIFLFLSGIGYFFIRKKDVNLNMYKSHTKYTMYGGLLCIITFFWLFFKNMDKAYNFKGDVGSKGLDQVLALTFMAGIFLLFIGFMIYLINILITIFYSDEIESK